MEPEKPKIVSTAEASRPHIVLSNGLVLYAGFWVQSDNGQIIIDVPQDMPIEMLNILIDLLIAVREKRGN